jgi:Putative transposase/Transposase zinc-binding domain
MTPASTVTMPATIRLADIIREHGPTFLAHHGARLAWEQKKALRDVAACRTAALGGHVFRCVGCGHDRIAYNSCRNRHCPTCRASAPAAWLEAQAEHLLPVEYHHVVFTLPEQTHTVARLNPRTVYNALFRAAAETIQQVAADPRHLGAEVGLLLVLHTWGQNLHFHPHVHGVVTGGGLACDRAGNVASPPRWQSCRPGFFLPVRVLSAVFRGKFLALLREAFAAGKLAGFADAAEHARWEQGVQALPWVVYSKPPWGGPEVVLKYLALYTHRVALSERRLVGLGDGQVTFTAKDYRRDGKVMRITLSAEEFLRRWVQHVLPRGLVKVRYYGLLANRTRQTKIALCRRLLWPAVALRSLAAFTEETRAEEACPTCGCRRWLRLGEVAGEVAGEEPARRCARADTS